MRAVKLVEISATHRYSTSQPPNYVNRDRSRALVRYRVIRTAQRRPYSLVVKNTFRHTTQLPIDVSDQRSIALISQSSPHHATQRIERSLAKFRTVLIKTIFRSRRTSHANRRLFLHVAESALNVATAIAQIIRQLSYRPTGTDCN